MAFVQLVTFELANEEYGIDINVINGIVKSKSYKVIKIPNSPEYMEGIINLRGKVNPIFNLKKKFNISDEGIKEDSKIIIINNGDSTVGFIVDEVTDIYRLKDDEIEPVPSGIRGNERGYLQGIAKVEDKMIIILDLIRALSEEEITKLHTVADFSV